MANKIKNNKITLNDLQDNRTANSKGVTPTDLLSDCYLFRSWSNFKCAFSNKSDCFSISIKTFSFNFFGSSNTSERIATCIMYDSIGIKPPPPLFCFSTWSRQFSIAAFNIISFNCLFSSALLFNRLPIIAMNPPSLTPINGTQIAPCWHF